MSFRYKCQLSILLCLFESPAWVPRWDKHPCDMNEHEQKQGILLMPNTKSRTASSVRNKRINNIDVIQFEKHQMISHKFI